MFAKFYTERIPIIKNNMLNTYTLLNDKRIFFKLDYRNNGGYFSFSKLIDFLDNPNTIQSILLLDNDNVIEIKWDK